MTYFTSLHSDKLQYLPLLFFTAVTVSKYCFEKAIFWMIIRRQPNAIALHTTKATIRDLFVSPFSATTFPKLFPRRTMFQNVVFQITS